MIPVLGIPILAGPDLLWSCLRSIDVPVGEIVVIDNGDAIHEVPDGVPSFTHVWPGYNMGVAASWNHVIKMRFQAAWWMLAGFDIEFAPGDLARLDQHMEEQGGIALLNGYSAFGLDRETVRCVGLFDENYIPAYFEDNDYDYRCRLAEVPYVSLPSGSRHRVSSTLRDSYHLSRENSYSFPSNGMYFKRKWGGAPYRETYPTPFDAGGDPRSWTLDFDRLADQSWKREE